MKTIFGILMVCLFSVGISAQDAVPVNNVELTRYAGKWYEIARYPNKFQEDCAGNVTAEYTILGNGKVRVTNKCTNEDGETETAIGEAKVENDAGSKLKVRFAPKFLSFLPFVWSDYWILELDDDYKYAAVGTPDHEYLWILSRTPTLDDDTYNEIVQNMVKMGYKENRIVKTVQGY